jgi:hypothetical protein
VAGRHGECDHTDDARYDCRIDRPIGSILCNATPYGKKNPGLNDSQQNPDYV